MAKVRAQLGQGSVCSGACLEEGRDSCIEVSVRLLRVQHQTRSLSQSWNLETSSKETMASKQSYLDFSGVTAKTDNPYDALLEECNNDPVSCLALLK